MSARATTACFSLASALLCASRKLEQSAMRWPHRNRRRCELRGSCCPIAAFRVGSSFASRRNNFCKASDAMTQVRKSCAPAQLARDRHCRCSCNNYWPTTGTTGKASDARRRQLLEATNSFPFVTLCAFSKSKRWTRLGTFVRLCVS